MPRLKKPKRITGGLNASRTSMSKLTDSDVRDIRRLWDTEALTVREIALRYNMGVESIRKIGRRDSFIWVTERLSDNEMAQKAKESLNIYKDMEAGTLDLCPYPLEKWSEAELKTANSYGIIPNQADGWYKKDDAGNIVRIR